MCIYISIGGSKVTQKKKGKAAAVKNRAVPAKGKSSAARSSRSAQRGAAGWQGGQTENKSRMLALIAIVGVVAILGAYFLDSSALLRVNAAGEEKASDVRINELQAENVSTLVTENGDVPDWIEITKTGREKVNVGKYSLLLDSNFNRMFYEHAVLL